MNIETTLNILKLIVDKFPSKIYSFDKILAKLEFTVDGIFKIKQTFLKNETYINEDEVVGKVLDSFFNEYLEKIDMECGPESNEFKNLADEIIKVYGSSYIHLYGIKHNERIKDGEYSYNIPKVGDKKQKFEFPQIKK